MTISSTLRTAGLAATLVSPLLLGPGLFAQDQLTPPSETNYGRAPIPAPVGHRQPRAADIPPTARTPAELQEERQQAELNRRLRICRGC
jgi:hypothetical protein